MEFIMKTETEVNKILKHGIGFQSICQSACEQNVYEESQRIKKLTSFANKNTDMILELSDIAYRRQLRENSIPEC